MRRRKAKEILEQDQQHLEKEWRDQKSKKPSFFCHGGLLDSLDTEEFTAVFNSVCLDVMNDVAPLSIKRPEAHAITVEHRPEGKLNADGKETNCRSLMKC